MVIPSQSRETSLFANSLLKLHLIPKNFTTLQLKSLCPIVTSELISQEKKFQPHVYVCIITKSPKNEIDMFVNTITQDFIAGAQRS